MSGECWKLSAAMRVLWWWIGHTNSTMHIKWHHHCVATGAGWLRSRKAEQLRCRKKVKKVWHTLVIFWPKLCATFLAENCTHVHKNSTLHSVHVLGCTGAVIIWRRCSHHPQRGGEADTNLCQTIVRWWLVLVCFTQIHRLLLVRSPKLRQTETHYISVPQTLGDFTKHYCQILVKMAKHHFADDVTIESSKMAVKGVVVVVFIITIGIAHHHHHHCHCHNYVLF